MPGTINYLLLLMRKLILILILFLCGGVWCYAQSTPDREATMCVGDTATMTATASNADSFQWYRNNVAIAGANNDTLISYQGGIYFVRVFNGDSKGCFDQSGDIRIYIETSRANDDYVTVPLGKNAVMNVLLNDDPKCAPFDKSTFHIVSQPTIGTIVSAADGIVTYKPSPTIIGADKFTYVISDIEGRTTNVATVYLDLFLDCAIVYPNPVGEELNITVNAQKIHAVRIYDMAGRELHKENVAQNIIKIDVHTYAQGVYMVELIEKNGPGCIFKIQKK